MCVGVPFGTDTGVSCPLDKSQLDPLSFGMPDVTGTAMRKTVKIRIIWLAGTTERVRGASALFDSPRKRRPAMASCAFAFESTRARRCSDCCSPSSERSKRQTRDGRARREIEFAQATRDPPHRGWPAACGLIAHSIAPHCVWVWDAEQLSLRATRWALGRTEEEATAQRRK